jgi:hypothetical protein
MDARSIIADELAKWKESQDLSTSQPPQGEAIIAIGEQTGKVGKPIPKKPRKE